MPEQDGTNDIVLTCYACSATYSCPTQRCSCGEPVWFVSPERDFDWPTQSIANMWAFTDLLPISDPDEGISAATGGTPLFRVHSLDEFAGVSVYVKNEAFNPTGSFKDRGSCIGVLMAKAMGFETVGTVSYGNMAISMAAYAAAYGTDCVILVPDDIPDIRLQHIARYGPRIVQVTGDYGALYQKSLELGVEHKIHFVNSDSPARVAGQKTTGLEILQHSISQGYDLDAIVLPVSSGGHASGIWKGYKDLKAGGVSTDFPPIYLVQAAATAPIAMAFERGSTSVDAVSGADSVAYSITNPNPPSGNRALEAVIDSGGKLVAVEDEEILTAQRTLLEQSGIYVEASSASVLAGIRKLTQVGALSPDDTVAAILTGDGFKEGNPPNVPMEVEEATMGELDTKL